jgi:excisionase family DNA binding protein
MPSRPPTQRTRTTTAARVGIAEAATYADVSTRTIRRWIAAGLIPGYRIGPRLIKVDLSDLDQLGHRIPTGGAA